jgi:hypothetical protein
MDTGRLEPGDVAFDANGQPLPTAHLDLHRSNARRPRPRSKARRRAGPHGVFTPAGVPLPAVEEGRCGKVTALSPSRDGTLEQSTGERSNVSSPKD